MYAIFLRCAMNGTLFDNNVFTGAISVAKNSLLWNSQQGRCHKSQEETLDEEAQVRFEL